MISQADEGATERGAMRVSITEPNKVQGFSGTFSLTDSEWRKKLTTLQYKILRKQGTEPAGSSCLVRQFPKTGFFACVGCDLPLYSTTAKFKDYGWPAWDMCFYSKDRGCHVRANLAPNGDVEITCGRCYGHLGHVFYGEGHTKTDERH